MQSTADSSIAEKALQMVRINIPYLAQLSYLIILEPCYKIRTAGIFLSGRLIYNPNWFSKLSLEDATFVMAHEVMHLALRSHERTAKGDNLIFNITHDLIINNELKKILKIKQVPANGLDWNHSLGKHYGPIEGKSAEELLPFIEDAYANEIFRNRLLKEHWSTKILTIADESASSSLSEQLRRLLLSEKNEEHDLEKDMIQVKSDILSDDLEREIFPSMPVDKQKQLQKRTYHHLGQFQALKLINKISREKFHKIKAKKSSATYEAIESLFTPPWEEALQNWLEFTTRTGKTYARPSRRGYSAAFVRPGYKRDGRTIHIVVDTSGSMSSELGIVLGAIASFCEALMVPSVHIVQCDTEVSDDSWYSPEELASFEIKGLGGSNMSPGMQLLAEDEAVDYILVITDGSINYPKEPLPYEVLWVLTHKNLHFSPNYGRVILLR